MTALVSCCLSAAGPGFSGHPVPPGASAPLTICLPPRHLAARTRAGFPCSARVRPGWLRVPSVPRGGGVHTTGVLPGRRLPLLNGQPCRPGLQPAPGRIIDEASARVQCHSPHTSLPLTCAPGRNGTLGLSPELRTQPGRTQQRTSGRGQAWTLPGLRLWHQPASFDVLTHNVRPHVAKNWSICARPSAMSSCPEAARNRRSIGTLVRGLNHTT